MSLRVDRVQLEIIINNDQARKQMRLLDEELKQAYKDLRKLPEGSEEWVRKSADITRIKAQLENIKREIGITGMTMKELIAHQKELNSVMLHMNPNLPQYKLLQKELSETNARIKELRGGAQQVGSSFGKLADGFNRYFAFVTAAVAGLTTLILGFRKAVDAANEFEKSLDNLSALTGLSGQVLQELGEEAKKLSISQVENGIRITQSATEIVDAFTKVGSARPELLKNKEALQQVTQEAIILSEAANSELQPAVDALAGVLNQFNAPATDSRRIINALAAGSKEGAGEIPYLTEAIEKSGTVAADVGMNYEQLIGVIETLAPRMSQPEIAGRSLKNIILQLEQSAKETRPSVVGFAQAIENLGKKHLDTTELVKMFGQENITAGKILINNVSEIKKYTEAVTGTEVAIEQASVNTDNNSSKLEQAKNRFNLIAIELGDKLAPALTFSTNGVSYLIKATLALIRVFQDHKNIVLILTAITGYWIAAKTRQLQVSIANSLAMKEGILLKIKDAVVMQALIVKEELLTIWKARGTVASKLAATAQWAWNAAVAANPIGAIIAGISGMVVAINLLESNSREAVKREQEKIDVQNKAIAINSRIEDQYKKLSKSVETINSLSAQEKLDIAEKIDLNIKLAQTDLKLLQFRAAHIESENKRITYFQAVKSFFGLFADAGKMAAENGKEAAAATNEQVEKLKQNIINLNNQKVTVSAVVNAESEGDKILGKTWDQLDEKQKKYQVAIKNTEAGSEAFIRIHEKIRLVNKELEKFQPASPDESKASDKFKKLEQDYQDLLESMNSLDEKHLGEKLNQFQREILATQQKYDTLIDKAKKFIADHPELKTEQKISITQRIENLETQKDASVKSILIRQEEQFSTDVLTIRNKLRIAELSGYEKEIEEINTVYSMKIRLLEEEQKASEDYFTAEIINAEGNAVKLEQILAEREKSFKAFVDKTAAYEQLKAIETENLRKAIQRKIDDELAQYSKAFSDSFLSQEAQELAAIDDKYTRMVMMAEEAGLDISKIMMAYAEETENYKLQKAQETQKEIRKFILAQAQLSSDTYFTILSKTQSAASEAKISKLEVEKQKELSSKRLTEEQKKQIEEKYAKLEAVEKTKAWKNEQKAAATQAVINGALAVTNIWATTPKADFGVTTMLLLAASIASTLAQVAVIKAEKPPQFLSGGYTGKGKDDEPAGIVHANEYVVPSELLEDPIIKQYVKIIESKRLGNKVLLREENASKTAKPVFSLPEKPVPMRFNTPEIEKAIRHAPHQAMMEFSSIQTQELVQRLNPKSTKGESLKNGSFKDPELTRVLSKLEKKMEVLDHLHRTLKSGNIRSKIVWTDLQEAEKSVSDMIADTSA